jgi:PLP-dependent transaminase
MHSAPSKAITDELIELDRKAIVHPYLPSAVTDRVVMASGSGCRLRDSDGREYLDATGGLWLAQVGHAREELAEAARTQIEKLEYFTSFWEFSNEPAIRLATLLTELAPPRQRKVYFTSGGSEGNEAALKMARYAHWQRGDGDRTWILARSQGYHGVGYGSGTATGFPGMREGFGPMLPHVRYLTAPWPYRSELFDGQDPTDFLIEELRQTIDELGPQNIAAFIGEPIMGVAGMIVPPEGYWPRVAAVLAEHGITFIFDEVVTAYGRVGTWFGAEHFGVEPDIIVTAKGITSGYAPLGAVLLTDEIASAISADGFPMGFTYNGHPTSCAIALKNLEIIRREGLLARAREIGAYLLEQLRELEPLPVVGEVRGDGMMLALELVADKESREPLAIEHVPQDEIRRQGVIVRNCAHSLVLSPPLILTHEEADEIVGVIGGVLRRLSPSGELAPA